MSGQNTLLAIAEDAQVKRPSHKWNWQVFRNTAAPGSGIYKAMDLNGVVEIIGGPGFGSGIPFGNDTDIAANNVQVAIPGATLTDGYTFEVNILTTNTGATTLQVNALGVKSVVDSDGNALVAGMLDNESIYLFVYDLQNDRYQLLGLAKPSPEEIWERGTGAESVKLINTVQPNTASGDHSYAEGQNNVSSGLRSHSEGANNTSGPADNTHAEGVNTTASGPAAHAEGTGTVSSGDSSHAEGGGSTASGPNAHAEGDTTQATGDNSHSEGRNTEAIGANSHAEGFDTTAIGDNSHSEGGATESVGINSHAEGDSTLANGAASHAEGSGTIANTDYAHAEGFQTVASGQSSHAEGETTQAISNNTHAEGSSTVASGGQAHAEGNNTLASGDNSHSEGLFSIASGMNSHAGGNNTESLGDNSFNHSGATAPGDSIASGVNSAILGGLDNNVDAASPRSVALGGTANDIIGEPDTAQAQNLRVTGDLRITQGANKNAGVSAALVAGTLVVANASVKTGAIIMLVHNTPAGVQGILSAPDAGIVNGVSFTINSSNAADTGTVNYLIINP